MFNKSEGENPVYEIPDPEPTYRPKLNTNEAKVVARAVIGATIKFKGDLTGEEDLEVQGQFEGKIELKQHNLTVGKKGSLKADVRAKIITVEGKVEGDLIGAERVIVRESGNVRGNMVAPRVSLEDGAKFKGSIDMEPGVDKPAASADRTDRTGHVSAVPQTNNKEKTKPASDSQIKSA